MELDKYYNSNELCTILDMELGTFTNCYTKNNFFKTLVKVGKRYYVLKDEVNELKEQLRPYQEMEDFYYTDELSKLLNVHSETLLKYIKKGYFPNAIKTIFYSSKWKIPKSDVEAYINKLEEATLNKEKKEQAKREEHNRKRREKRMLESKGRNTRSYEPKNLDGFYWVKDLSNKYEIDQATLKNKLLAICSTEDYKVYEGRFHFKKEFVDKLSLCDFKSTPPKNTPHMNFSNHY